MRERDGASARWRLRTAALIGAVAGAAVNLALVPFEPGAAAEMPNRAQQGGATIGYLLVGAVMGALAALAIALIRNSLVRR